MKFQPIVKRFPKLLYGGDYNPDQWLDSPKAIDEDFRMMKLAGCNTLSIGIFSWSALEPEEGRFEFSWLDDIMDRIAANGWNANLATPSAARPPWMAKKYPEVQRVDRNGLRQPYNSRHNQCWSSPVFREKVGIINRKLAERYKSHPALAIWHVSNEYTPGCFCDLCIASFHRWLELRYKTLGSLNNAWWTSFWSHRYTAWDEIDPRDNCVDGLTMDWKRFLTWQLCDMMRHEIAPLRELTPNIPVTTNMMELNDFGMDYWKVAEICDFVANDSYPSWDSPSEYVKVAAEYAMMHDTHRSMKGGRPFLIMESGVSSLNWKERCRLKRPGVHRLEMLLAMGHGADGTLFFQWRKGRGAMEKFHAAPVDHVGHEHTRVFKDVAEIGSLQAKLEGIVGCEVPAETAIIHDWEVRWALDASSGPASPSKKHLRTIIDHYRALFGLNTPIDVIQSTCDFSKYKLLVAPMLFMLRPGVAERLKDFVVNGGTLVSTYLSGYVNETNLCFTGGWPGNGLRNLFGIWNEELDGSGPEDRQFLRMLPGCKLNFEGDFAVHDFAERIHAEGAETLAVYGQDFYAGEPALTVNSFGKGKAYYIAARTGDGFLAAFYRALVEGEQIKTVIPLDNKEGIHASLRTDGQHRCIFLYNCNQAPVEVKLPPGRFIDAFTNEDISGKTDLGGWGTAVLRADLSMPDITA